MIAVCGTEMTVTVDLQLNSNTQQFLHKTSHFSSPAQVQGQHQGQVQGQHLTTKSPGNQNPKPKRSQCCYCLLTINT